MNEGRLEERKSEKGRSEVEGRKAEVGGDWMEGGREAGDRWSEGEGSQREREVGASSGSSLYFNFNFTKNDYVGNLTCNGDASSVPNDVRCKDLARTGLTKDSQSGINGSMGIAYYNQPVPLWDKITGEVTSFTTTFSFKIQNTTESYFADGLAFFLSAYPPLVTIDGGATLGLFNFSTMLNESANQIVAAEFDTFSNSGWDPSSFNETKSHIGIDINKINSTVFESIPNNLFIGKNMTAQISYNNFTQNLSLHLSQDDNRTNNYDINTTVDLKRILSNEVAIGFSATTGLFVELHLIYSWSFNSTFEVSPGIDRKKRLTKKNRETEMACDESMDDEFEKGKGPKKFQYKELSAITNDFAENQKLGEGGFASVYQGILSDGVEVAIKRVSKGSKQGKKEYISEVKIISRLRHRNLVQLIGWCHDHGEFLLVYELMHNGSLDTHLYCNERVMAWPVRHKIALGLGSALLYLHEGCEQCVVYRDIKPSNIMLDSLFNAKLGDFGLARLIDHEAGAQATIPAGTTGYIAPESVITGIASAMSDVYSFGIVLLEIVCGRRPVMVREDENKAILVKWVWDLYGNNSILDAMDSRLNGEFEAREAERLLVVGLWCAYPDCTLRPSIRQAMSVLQFESPLPALSSKMPELMYANSTDHSSFYSASTGATSGAASSTISHATCSSNTSAIEAPSFLDSSWLLKEEII
ncbi:hypothetical protein LUZ61_000007 [Rhynchospora tenuis]|uniref:Protein kinase domain-containing protein n=1 Tax=Rhynchospora tenuis TaxID=198213 RepID=A0AAD5ZEB8_9POAL|nr:hypothetical protein LUZ61_000007 [Rhynchospora tenuis]